MKLAIILATRDRPELLRGTVGLTLTNIREKDTQFIIACDEDDEPSIAAARELLAFSPQLEVSVGPREDTLGGKYNRVQRLAPDADVYLAMVDYAPHMTPGFDSRILAAASLFEDGIGVVYNHMANLSFPQINAVTAKLAALMGFMYPPFFPYWFVDHWLDDIARMIGRVAIADVWIDTSRRPGTMDRRETPFWATFYDAGYLDRRRCARRIIRSDEFLETPARKELLLNGIPLIEEHSIMVNNEARAIVWPVKPEEIDDRYRRLKAAAQTMLRTFVAEIEADEATRRINQAAAAA